MPKIKMLITTPGALDGIHIKNFEKGLLYSIPDQISVYLSNLFLNMGVAEEIKIVRQRGLNPSETKPNTPSETKELPLGKNQKILDDMDKENNDDEKKEESKKIVVMRVFQLSDELNIPSKEIIKVAKGIGINVTAPASGLSEEEVDKIKKELS